MSKLTTPTLVRTVLFVASLIMLALATCGLLLTFDVVYSWQSLARNLFLVCTTLGLTLCSVILGCLSLGYKFEGHV